MTPTIAFLLACGLAACATPTHGPASQAPPPEHPATSAPVASAPDPVLTSAPSPPAPSVDAPPTPPRTYDFAACRERVATFRDRLQDVIAHERRANELTDGIRPVPSADVDLRAPSVVVEVRDSRDRDCAEWAGSWGVTVHAKGRKLRFDGRDRVAGTVRAVEKALRPGERIEVRSSNARAMVPLEPLLVALSRVAPIQLAVGVAGPPYPLESWGAPPWAAERLAAIAQLPESMLEPQQSRALRAAIKTASSECSAIQAALDEAVSNDAASTVDEIARLVPDAVSRCACTNLDVDALEVLLGWWLGGNNPTVSRGWLEVRIVEASDTKVPMWRWASALHAIAALPHDERVRGIQIVTFDGQPASTLAPDGKCSG